MKTARRLDIIEEYYFSSKLREVRQLALGEPIINMGIGSPDLRPSQSVIDAVKLALKMKMHINTELSGIARIAKKYG
jgi:aspartate/methionine/tyrosine aminotransferase